MQYQTVSISGNIKPFGTKKRVLGFPSTWGVGFGDDYYVRQFSPEAMLKHSQLPLIITGEPGIYNPNPEIKIPSRDHVAGEIEIIMKDMAVEGCINE